MHRRLCHYRLCWLNVKKKDIGQTYERESISSPHCFHPLIGHIHKHFIHAQLWFKNAHHKCFHRSDYSDVMFSVDRSLAEELVEWIERKVSKIVWIMMPSHWDWLRHPGSQLSPSRADSILAQQVYCIISNLHSIIAIIPAIWPLQRDRP